MMTTRMTTRTMTTIRNSMLVAEAGKKARTHSLYGAPHHGLAIGLLNPAALRRSYAYDQYREALKWIPNVG